MKFLAHSFMKLAPKALAVIAMLVFCLNAAAVTDAEMDEAKAIAAKFYVRYINNGAGYLDNWLPKSMADLEKKLSNKTDKENLRKFKSVSTPSDYASWDKNRLVSYWSESFFAENAPMLDPKAASNAMCKKQIKQAVGRMAVAAPTPEPETQGAAPADAQIPEGTQAEEQDKIAEELAQVDAEIQEAQDLADQEAEKPVQKKNTGTWVYIMVLAILVAVVIFLVVYASRTMKGQPRKKAPEQAYDDEEEEPAVSPKEEEPVVYTAIPPVAEERRYVSEDTRMREKYAEALATKSEEIRNLNRQLNDMELLAGRLKDENRKLKAEVEQLRKYVTTSQPHATGSERRHDTEATAEAASQRMRTVPSQPKEIYLGRVNSRGIFVRADRHAVDGQSIFKLTTTDGQTGTYTLIHNPLIEEQALDDPGKWLAGGCVAKDIFDTDGRQGIFTETPGRAVFREGAWIVDRKAKIRYC